MVRFGWTTRADGDLSGDLGAPGRARPAGDLAAAPWPWTWLEQVHGAEVVVVSAPGEHAGSRADAAITATTGCAVAVRTADCAPVVLVGEEAVGVVHAGWRGLAAGVVERAVAAMHDLGRPPVEAHLGPCIRPGCYEFGAADLDLVAESLGDGVRATTMWGAPALDVPGAVRRALREAGVGTVRDAAGCTACDARWYSHRARREPQRIATVAWIER